MDIIALLVQTADLHVLLCSTVCCLLGLDMFADKTITHTKSLKITENPHIPQHNPQPPILILSIYIIYAQGFVSCFLVALFQNYVNIAVHCSIVGGLLLAPAYGI